MALAQPGDYTAGLAAYNNTDCYTFGTPIVFPFPTDTSFIWDARKFLEDFDTKTPSAQLGTQDYQATFVECVVTLISDPAIPCEAVLDAAANNPDALPDPDVYPILSAAPTACQIITGAETDQGTINEIACSCDGIESNSPPPTPILFAELEWNVGGVFCPAIQAKRTFNEDGSPNCPPDSDDEE